MGFHDEARALTKDVREAVLGHPFVQGIGDGTLDRDKFRFYLVHDYLFLVAYARVLALAAAKSESLETMGRFASLLHATLETEMGLHRETCAGFGLTAGELEAAGPAPACRAYTDHLLATAWAEPLPVICASLVPCQYGYAEIASDLAPGSPAGNPYAEWIAAYTSEEYRALAAWLCDLTDRLAEAGGGDERARMLDAYGASAKHELAFWEMAWRGA